MSNMQIMIIEDDYDARTIFERTLKLKGYSTIAFAEGDNALRYLTDNQPALILLDMHLPVISGHEILDFIRQQDHLKDTPVIIVSADSAMSAANDDKADLIMLKPVNMKRLVQLIERLWTQIVQTS